MPKPSPRKTEAEGEKTTESDKAKQERIEKLRQKAIALTERAKENLIKQFGSIEVARAYAEKGIRDPYGREQNPEEVSKIYFAQSNLRVLEEVPRLQGYIEEGHEDYSHIPPFFDKRMPSLESELEGLERSINRANFPKLPETEPEKVGSKEQQIERLTAELEELLKKYESVKNDPAYRELEFIGYGLEKQRTRIGEDGKLEVSYPPLSRYTKLEDKLAELERRLANLK
jgi:hypothetical protein